MRESNFAEALARHNATIPAIQLRQPNNCSVRACSAIAMYQQELERHRATVSSLRDSVFQENDLLRQKDELILQKDILTKESEHRLMNGLQLIVSVLTLQSRSTKSPETAAQLKMAATRVATLARVHQRLHAMDALETVDFKQYLEMLCHDLSEMVPGESAERSLCVEGAELTIQRVIATPLAFIVSELITNSIKYAKGKILINLQTMPNGDAVLSVSDQGPGLPEAFDPAATGGLGMKIIAALVSQIHGELTFTKGDHDCGARFSVLFSPQA